MPPRPRNRPVAAFRVVTALPGSPRTGESVTYAGHALLWDGARWALANGTGYARAAGDGVAVRQAVTFDDGAYVPTDIDNHTHVDGVVAAVAGGLAFVVHMGVVGGFAGLTPGADLAVGPDPGSVAEPGGARARLLLIGRALSATEILVQRSAGIGL